MAWKTFHLGSNVHATTAAEAAAPIITEQLGECSYASEKLTYTYGGNTYSIQVKAANSSHLDNYILALNTETGEFFISSSNTTYNNDTFYRYIASAIFLVQLDDDSTVLVPITSFADNYITLFNVIGGYSTTNKTTHITLYPATTCSGFGTTNGFRLIPGLYATHLNFAITAGQTIEVDGQQFLCVACGLFAKL